MRVTEAVRWFGFEINRLADLHYRYVPSLCLTECLVCVQNVTASRTFMCSRRFQASMQGLAFDWKLPQLIT